MSPGARSTISAWTLNAETLLNNLELTASGEFITVSYEGSSAQKAQDILTKQVENALASLNSIQARPAIAAGQFVDAQLTEQGKTLAAAQDALLKFQLEHAVGDVDREINAMQDVVRGLQNDRDASEIEAIRAETLAKQYDAFVTEGEQALQAAVEQLTKAQTVVEGEATPAQQQAIDAITAQVAALQDEVRANRDAQRGQSAAAAALRATIAENEALASRRAADLAQLIGLSSQYSTLQTALKNEQDDYDLLRAKAAEARLKQDQIAQMGTMQIVEPAFLPGQPASSAALRLAASGRSGRLAAQPGARARARADQTHPNRAMNPLVRSKLLNLTTPPDFAYKTTISRDRIPQFVEHLGKQAVILNLGSGRTNYGPSVVNLDIGPFPNVDIVAMGEQLPVLDSSLDAVITQGVLEHVPDLAATLAEIDRVLRPGGLVYHEIPFIQGFHGSPGDFRRFTLTGIRELALGYDVLDAGVTCGPSSAMLWISSEWLALLFSFGNDVLFKAGRRGFAWLLSPIKLADAWLERNPHADLIASAFYIVARQIVAFECTQWKNFCHGFHRLHGLPEDCLGGLA